MPVKCRAVWINYPYRVMYIRFIGTDAQYDAVDAQTVYEKVLGIKPVKTKRDYESALKEIEALMTGKANYAQLICDSRSA